MSTDQPSTTGRPPTPVMEIDLDRCIGCHACVSACREENQTAPGVQWMSMQHAEVLVPDREPRAVSLPRPCLHCDHPECVRVCPTGAVFKRESDGLVIVDHAVCIGCGYCVLACPFEAMNLSTDVGSFGGELSLLDRLRRTSRQEQGRASGLAEKCEFCWERRADGLEPACAAACPTRAITFVTDPARIAKPVKEPVFIPFSDLSPNVRYHVSADGRATRSLATPSVQLRRRDSAMTPNRGSRGQSQWSWSISGALFFEALSVGLLWVAAWAMLADGAQWSWIHRAAAVSSPVAMAVGMLVLFAHLGAPLRFLGVVHRWRHSWMSRGSILATTTFVGAVVVAADVVLPGLTARFLPSTAVTVVAILFSVVGLALVLYPAFLLRTLYAFPFWKSTVIPVLLVASAALGGASVTGLLAAAAPPSGAWPGEMASGPGALRVVTVVLFATVLLASWLLLVVARRQAAQHVTAAWPARAARLWQLTMLASAVGTGCLLASFAVGGAARPAGGLGFLAGAVVPLLARQLVLAAGVRRDWVPSLTPFFTADRARQLAGPSLDGGGTGQT